MARRALVPALGLELEHADLRPALVPDDGGPDGDVPELVAEQRLVAAGVQERLEVDGGALVGSQPLDEEGRPLLDAVLLPAGADDGIRGFGHVSGHSLASETSAASPSAFARERRRPPLRPRRRGFDCTASSPSSGAAPDVPSPAASSAASSGASEAPAALPRPRLRRRPLGRAVSSSASATAAGPVPACTEASSSASAPTASASSPGRPAGSGSGFLRVRGRGADAARLAARSRALRRSTVAAAASSAA